jgi:hypothetical protein
MADLPVLPLLGIPVLLAGAKRESLPALLVNTTWVEFRGSVDDSDAFHRLVSGICGVTPGPTERMLEAAHDGC